MALARLLALLLACTLPALGAGGLTPWQLNFYTNITDMAANAAPLSFYKIVAVGNLDGSQFYFATNVVTGTNTTTRIASAATPGYSWQLISTMSTSSGGVPTNRTINTTSPLTGGGPLTTDLTLAIPVATSSANGYLSSNDWSTFNGKQAAFTTGAGVTNISAVLSANLAAGTNAVLTTNSNGQIAINNSATSVSGANPTATIGLSAVNGSASTYLRSDGAPALPTTGNAIDGAILTPWVQTDNSLALTWRKAPQVWEFLGNAAEWTTTTANGGSAATPGTQPTSADQGTWQANTASNTNSVAGFRMSTIGIVFTTNSFAVTWKVYTPAALSSDSTSYEIYAGCGDSTGDAAPTDGAVVYYNHTASTSWLGKTYSNSNVTTATGGGTMTVAAATWYKLKVEGTASTVNFWASSNDGASWTFLGSSSSNIPSTTARISSIEAYIRKIGGSSGSATQTIYAGRCEFWPNVAN